MANRNPEWYTGLTEKQILEAMIRATASPHDLGIQPINTKDAEYENCGVAIFLNDGTSLTSMCFWLCVARALEIDDPCILVSAMGIVDSHPATDAEIRTFCSIYPVKLMVRGPTETVTYPCEGVDCIEVNLWLDGGHYTLGPVLGMRTGMPRTDRK